MRGVLFCVQDFVRDLLFTQRNFFSESGVTLLSEVGSISDSITSSSVYAAWSKFKSKSFGQGFGDVNTCFGRALDRRRVVKYTSEQWYALEAVRHLVNLAHKTVSAYQPFWKKGRLIKRLLLLHPVRLLVRSDITPLQEKEKRKCPGSPVKLPRQFEVSSSCAGSQKHAAVEGRTFAYALASQLPRGKNLEKWARPEKLCLSSRGGCLR